MGADGSPHVAPVWFILDGEDLVFMTEASSVKGRAMLNDPRVTICVDDERPPYAFAIIRGKVSISRDLDQMLLRSRAATWVTTKQRHTGGATRLTASCS